MKENDSRFWGKLGQMEINQSLSKNHPNVGLFWLVDCNMQKRLHTQACVNGCLENKQASGKKASLRPPPGKTTLRALSFDYLLVANKGTPPEMTKQEERVLLQR